MIYFYGILKKKKMCRIKCDIESEDQVISMHDAFFTSFIAKSDSNGISEMFFIS